MAKVKIDAKTALEDIRAGMSDSALMDKHKLSAMGLQSLFDKLLQRRSRQPVRTRQRGSR